MDMRHIINIVESSHDPLKAALEAHFGNAANFPDVETNDGWLFPDGTRSAECTNWMRYVRRLLGSRVEFYGFAEEDNPSSRCARIAGGHDFAVVDDRYIVDGWVKHVSGLSRQTVFDMQDPEEQPTIKALYGDRSKWERNDGHEWDIDHEKDTVRSRAMQGIAPFQS